MPNNLFESIYAGNDPRLGGLDPAMFQQLYQQYNGALQQWGPEAAQAVLQQQLAGLPQSPMGAGSASGPGGRGGPGPSFSPEAGRTGLGAGTTGLPSAFSPEAGRTGMGAGTATPQAPVGGGSMGGPGGRGGAGPMVSPEAGRSGMGAGTVTQRGGADRAMLGSAQRLGDIAAAAAGGAASQLAPNAGAGSIGGPGGRGGAGPMVSPEAGRTGMGAGTVSQRPAADQAMIGGARQAGAGTVTPTPRPVGGGSAGGPGGRGGAGPMVSPEAGRTGLGAGTTGPPSAFSPELARAQGAQPPPFSPEAGRTELGAGTAGPPSIRSNVTNPADIAMLATAERSGAGTAGLPGSPAVDPATRGGFSPGSPTPGGQGISPVPPFESADTAIHNWLGTEGAANLLEPGAGAPSAPGGSFWADGSPVSGEDQWMYDRWGPGPYTDEQIQEWLGTQQSQSLLGAGGSNFSDAPLGGVVDDPIKKPGYDPDYDWVKDRKGGIVPGGGDLDLGVGGGGRSDEIMPFYDPDTWDWSKGLADIERQYGTIDEQRVMTFADQERQQQQAQRGLPGAFNARGMLNSGQYDRAEGMQAGAFDRATGRTEMGFQAAENALSEAELQANTSGSFGAFQASFEEADRRAKEASNIGGAWY